jgi:hypothetical protein
MFNIVSVRSPEDFWLGNLVKSLFRFKNKWVKISKNILEKRVKGWS